MRKWWIILLVLIMMVPAAKADELSPTAIPTSDSVVEGGCNAPGTPEPIPTPAPLPLRNDPMLMNVVEIARRIDILAESELFMSFFTNGMVSQEQIEAVSYGTHERPVQAFHLNGQALIDALYAGESPEEMLDFTRPELLKDLVGELPEILWGRREETELAILSVLSRYKVFALPEAHGCGLYFLFYEEAAPVLVTWVAGNGCVNAAACFMPEEDLTAVRTADELSIWFMSMGMPSVVFEEVPLV